MKNTLTALYFRLCVDHAGLSLLLVALFVGSLAVYAPQFKLDASGDSLVLEGDQDYLYYQSISAKYNADDSLIVTYSPKGDLFSPEVIADVKALKAELQVISGVGEVLTYLDVPLVSSPPMTFSEILEKPRYLTSDDTDLTLAKKEFTTSPIYKNLLVSPDGLTCAIQIKFARDAEYIALSQKRNALREKRLTTPLSAEEQQALIETDAKFSEHSSGMQDQETQNIANIRVVLETYRNRSEIYLGGLPMIVSDMIAYIGHDIQVFGVGVLLFIILLLGVSFKRIHWVVLPIVICLASVMGMLGYLGLLDWRVTVVSSNFISLLLIITLSLTVHLVVRHQELHSQDPDMSQRDLIIETIRSKIEPSIYTIATTMVAFGSLLVSGIRPVIDFGWMMTIGVGLCFVLAFILFPAGLMFIKKGKPVHRGRDSTMIFTAFIASLIQRKTSLVFGFFILLVVFTTLGISKLTVENRFIDYFKSDTEIYQGMLKIDENLGGTTPLDVIIDPDRLFYEDLRDMQEMAEEDDLFMEEEDQGLSGSSYWFNTFMLERVDKIHAYLDNLPETGKVLSISSTMQMMKTLNENKAIDNIALSVIYNRMPEEIKQTLFYPYMSEDGNQLRFSIRVFESDYDLKRKELVEKIKHDLVEKFELEPEQIHLTGMMVLYNNMLQSLFSSQIMTIGVVFVAIMMMFLLLFRSLKIALIAIIPNMVAASLVLGMLGWLGIPLDIMTITIAAITIGIAVDNSIHYIHRFQTEYQQDQDYWAAVARTHASTGRAMYYTSMTVTLGFSILALSSFIPTIYFGLFTGMAMLVALLANLSLLPSLLVKMKVMG